MIALEQGTVIAGRYALVRQLARGGMGSVWIARHRDLEIDVTVKFMAPSLVAEAEARMRFEREAKLAARLRSQHVVQVHDYGVEDETPYIIMELLKGESLASRIEREGRLSLPVVAQLLVQICKALRTAHGASLVHRDLKPGNIFLAQKDEDEVVKILDFGIAKQATLGNAKTATATGALLGSVHYMSPEQVRDSSDVDHRSDLWSIGVILYRLLTGRLPFPGANLGEVLMRVSADTIPSTTEAGLPASLDGFFAHALARDPDRRFQSATEMSDAFRAIALAPAGPPGLAPTSRAEVSTKLTTRLAPNPPANPAQASPAGPPPNMAVSPPGALPQIPAQARVAAPQQRTLPVAPQLHSPPEGPASSSMRQATLVLPRAPAVVPTYPPVSQGLALSHGPRTAVLSGSPPVQVVHLPPPVEQPPVLRKRPVLWPLWVAIGLFVTLGTLGALALRSRDSSSSVPTTVGLSADVPLLVVPGTTPVVPQVAESARPADPLPPVPTPRPREALTSPLPDATNRPRIAPKPNARPLDRSD